MDHESPIYALQPILHFSAHHAAERTLLTEVELFRVRPLALVCSPLRGRQTATAGLCISFATVAGSSPNSRAGKQDWQLSATAASTTFHSILQTSCSL